jgi:hypothetical protein
VKAERDAGNYALLKYTEPNGDRRLVAAFVLENVVSPDVYKALTERDAAARWCDVSSGDGQPLTLRLPDAPLPIELVRARAMDQVEYLVRHGREEPSLIVATVTPAERQTLVTISHRHLPADEAPVWSRYWSGTVFLRLGDVLRRGAGSARPTIVKV